MKDKIQKIESEIDKIKVNILNIKDINSGLSLENDH